MKHSEFLKQALDLARVISLEKLWEDATGAAWENNINDYPEKLGLFFKDTGEFVIVPYVTKESGSGWKQPYEQQNAAIFVGWIGETELIDSSVYELLYNQNSAGIK